VGEQQGNLNALRQQLADTAKADFAVGEYHRSSHCEAVWLGSKDGLAAGSATPSSRTASTM
jgi:hypothetical protein